MTGGKPPGMSNIMKTGKNIFSEFERNNWAKSASRNVTSQALSACLAESQFNPSPHGPFYLLHLTAKGYIQP
jgi:hypothetical protein